MERINKYPMKTCRCPYCDGTGRIETGLDAEKTGKMIGKEIISEARKKLNL